MATRVRALPFNDQSVRMGPDLCAAAWERMRLISWKRVHGSLLNETGPAIKDTGSTGAWIKRNEKTG
jgi:hypothetical protein